MTRSMLLFLLVTVPAFLLLFHWFPLQMLCLSFLIGVLYNAFGSGAARRRRRYPYYGLW